MPIRCLVIVGYSSHELNNKLKVCYSSHQSCNLSVKQPMTWITNISFAIQAMTWIMNHSTRLFWTIQTLNCFGPFKHWTSSLFRSPQYFIFRPCTSFFVVAKWLAKNDAACFFVLILRQYNFLLLCKRNNPVLKFFRNWIIVL